MKLSVLMDRCVQIRLIWDVVIDYPVWADG